MLLVYGCVCRRGCEYAAYAEMRFISLLIYIIKYLLINKVKKCFFSHGLHGKHGLNTCYTFINPCFPCNPCLIILLSLVEYGNQFDICIKFGLPTIPEPCPCSVTSKNETYML